MLNGNDSGRPEAVVDLNLNVLIYEGGEVFNKKSVSDSSYMGLTSAHKKWPDFLEYKAEGNISVIAPKG